MESSRGRAQVTVGVGDLGREELISGQTGVHAGPRHDRREASGPLPGSGQYRLGCLGNKIVHNPPITIFIGLS